MSTEKLDFGDRMKNISQLLCKKSRKRVFIRCDMKEMREALIPWERSRQVESEDRSHTA
jgi:hypothetical protein